MLNVAPTVVAVFVNTPPWVAQEFVPPSADLDCRDQQGVLVCQERATEFEPATEMASVGAVGVGGLAGGVTQPQQYAMRKSVATMMGIAVLPCRK